MTSWSAASDFWITTRARAVTDDAEALTISSSRTGQPSGLGPARRSGCLAQRPQLGHAPGQQPRHLHLGDAEAGGRSPTGSDPRRTAAGRSGAGGAAAGRAGVAGWPAPRLAPARRPPGRAARRGARGGSSSGAGASSEANR